MSYAPARRSGLQSPETLAAYPPTLWYHVSRLAMQAYLRQYHDFSAWFPDTIPRVGPYLALTSHFSLLDVPALMTADPYYPPTSLVVKDSMLRVPIVRDVLRNRQAIAVARDGRDIGAIRRIRDVFKRGHGICVAAQGTRSRSGCLGPMHGVLMRIAIEAASKGVPVFPVVALGTFEALPPGARVPRPHHIRVVGGDPFDFMAQRHRKTRDDDVVEIASLVQRRLAEMLPPERRPTRDTPVVQWDR